MPSERTLNVCAAHVAPVYMDARATVEKACALIHDAAAKGADLIAFPESYVPGFPLWPAVSAPYRNHELFVRFAEQCIEVPSHGVYQLCLAAREAGIIVSIGISEATHASVGCLWNSNLLIGADGSILNHHRKIVPTYFEKLIWAGGDGRGLRVVETAKGRLGMLICGENTNPLARYSLIADGEQVHVSSYPPVWPTHESQANNAYDLPSAIRIRAGGHAFEGKVFNIVACSVLDDRTLQELECVGEDGLAILRSAPHGASMVIDPQGFVIAETASRQDELLMAKIDLADCVVPKQFHDIAGYYNRFDIFKLRVDRSPRSPLEYDDTGEPRAYDFDSLNAQWSEANGSAHTRERRHI